MALHGKSAAKNKGLSWNQTGPAGTASRAGPPGPAGDVAGYYTSTTSHLILGSTAFPYLRERSRDYLSGRTGLAARHHRGEPPQMSPR